MNQRIGIINPGAMGISVAATIKNSGFAVYWSSEGRSPQSKERAAQHGLSDAGTLPALCEQCDVMVSVCPPHAAETVAESVLGYGFQGLYLDANAIAPQRARRIAEKSQAAGVSYVDGGIIGGPAWEPERTWLYLSGQEAESAANYFAAGPLETEVIGTEVDKASALKMMFAAYTKGTTALLSAILGASEKLGVRHDLEKQWARGGSDFPEQTQTRVRRVTAKAWRFAGEMEEIAATFEEAGLPGGFHQAANAVYSRMAHFKDAEETPELMKVLQSLIDAD